LKITGKTKGLTQAQEALGMLANLTTEISGASFAALPRAEDSSKTNTDILNYQAEGTPSRDARFTEQDGEDASKIFKNRVEQQIVRILGPGAWESFKKRPSPLRNKQIGRQVATSALRRAMKHLQVVMRDNVENGDYPDVGRGYAARRAAKYGVPNNVALTLRASGQLLANLQGTRVRIHKRGSDNLLSLFGL